MQGVAPYLLHALLGAAVAAPGFAAAGAGGVAPDTPDLGLSPSTTGRSVEDVDRAFAAAAGISDHSGRERALVHGAVRDTSRSAGTAVVAESDCRLRIDSVERPRSHAASRQPGGGIWTVFTPLSQVAEFMYCGFVTA